MLKMFIAMSLIILGIVLGCSISAKLGLSITFITLGLLVINWIKEEDSNELPKVQ